MEYDAKMREYFEQSSSTQKPLSLIGLTIQLAQYLTSDKTSFASVSAHERLPVILVRLSHGLSIEDSAANH